jgi:hypothetical protein
MDHAKKPGVFFSMQCAVLLVHPSSQVYSYPAASINMNIFVRRSLGYKQQESKWRQSLVKESINVRSTTRVNKCIDP